MGRKSLIEIALLAALFGTLAFVWFQIAHTPAPDQALMRDIFYLFAGVNIPDRIGHVISEIAAELAEAREREEAQLLADRKSGIRQFSGHVAAIRHALANVPSATKIENTVLMSAGYNARRTSPLYADWLKQKVASSESGRCVWVEIVSRHLPKSHPQHKVIARLKRLGSDRYTARAIDDRAVPMPQITIFTLEGGRKEMILGWDSGTGPCFLVTDENAIAFFEESFARHLNRSTSDWATPVPPRLFGR